MTPAPSPALIRIQSDLDRRFASLQEDMGQMGREELAQTIRRLLALQVPVEMTPETLREVTSTLEACALSAAA